MRKVSGSRPDGVQEQKWKKRLRRNLGGEENRRKLKTARVRARERAIKSTFIHNVSRNYQYIYSIALGKSFLCFFQRCRNTSIHLGMKFLKLFVCILLKPMLRKNEQFRCSLYRRLYSISEQLVSLLAQDEYKQSKTLQTVHGEHSTIEKNFLKTFFTALKRAWP